MVDAMRPIADAHRVSVARIALDKASALPIEYPQWMLNRQHTGRVPS